MNDMVLTIPEIILRLGIAMLFALFLSAPFRHDILDWRVFR